MVNPETNLKQISNTQNSINNVGGRLRRAILIMRIAKEGKAMKKLSITITLFLLIFLLGCKEKKPTAVSGATPKHEKGKPSLTLPADLPEVGDKLKIDGANWKVIARGVEPFEYTSTGESLGLLPHKSEKMAAVIDGPSS